MIAEERVNGLNTLAALALDEESLSIIVNDMMVEKVAPLLKDSSTEVRLAAAGALRLVISALEGLGETGEYTKRNIHG